MEYFSILELDKEPFSNSPDPLFFYEATQHVACLQQLELAIRLRRGLNVVMGRVGTGKTTLSRELVRRLDKDNSIIVHLILDPAYSTGDEFLEAVDALLVGPSTEKLSSWQRKERIKNALFQAGVEENKTIVLLIDEGQKLSTQCLEIIREFLNYETNTKKLLQVVIFAQQEFEDHLAAMENFQDRINFLIYLGPMSFRDMRAMVLFRINKSSPSGHKLLSFSYPALWVLYRLSRGYPRKVINICHRVLLTLIVQGKKQITYHSVVVASGRTPLASASSGRFLRMGVAAFLVLAMVSGVWFARQPQGFSPMTWVSNLSLWDEITKQVYTPDIQEPIEPQAVSSKEPVQGPVTVVPVETTPPAIPKEQTSPVATSSAPAIPLPADATPVLAAEPSVITETLGTITLHRKDSFFSLIRTIYSVRSEADIHVLAKKIRQKNPALGAELEDIPAGTRVTLPTPEAVRDPLVTSSFWVQVAQTSSLGEAYRMFRDFSREHAYRKIMNNRSLLQLVILWNPHQKFRYSLILSRSFTNKSDAHAARTEAVSMDWINPVVVDADSFKDDILFSRLP